MKPASPTAASARREYAAARQLVFDAHPGLKLWLGSADTGISSKTMVKTLTGLDALGSWGPDAPYDSSDLNRCLTLLDRVPTLRPLLHEMTAVSSVWARMVGAWSRLESAFRLDAIERDLALKRYGRDRRTRPDLPVANRVYILIQELRRESTRSALVKGREEWEARNPAIVADARRIAADTTDDDGVGAHTLAVHAEGAACEVSVRFGYAACPCPEADREEGCEGCNHTGLMSRASWERHSAAIRRAVASGTVSIEDATRATGLRKPAADAITLFLLHSGDLALTKPETKL